MSTVADIINEIQYRVDSNATLTYIFNRAVRLISKRLYELESTIVQDRFSVTIYSEESYTADTIAFVDSDPDTITDTASQFVTEGFVAGMYIRTDEASNLGPFKINTAAAGTLTLVSTDSLTAAAAGSDVTITSEDDYCDLPTDFWGLIGKPWDEDKTYPLDPLPSQETRLQYPSAGSPLYYEIVGRKIYVTPATASDITIKGDYYKKPTSITGTSDTLPYDELFDDAIAELVVFLYKHSDVQVSQQALESFMQQNVDRIAARYGKIAPKQVPTGINWGF